MGQQDGHRLWKQQARSLAAYPLIVAKVGLPFEPLALWKSTPLENGLKQEVMQFIIGDGGLLGLFKSIGSQLLKGFLVQSILTMSKER